MDPLTHKRYLDYRETYGYFGRSAPMMSPAEFAAADQEHAELLALGEGRDDEQEARLAELARLLFRD